MRADRLGHVKPRHLVLCLGVSIKIYQVRLIFNLVIEHMRLLSYITILNGILKLFSGVYS